MKIKLIILTICGVCGAFLGNLFGGLNNAMITLFIFMCVDYFTGICVAAFFHKSTKTETGSLQSVAGFKGLCKKAAILLCVLVAYRLDVTIGSNYIRDCVVIAFCCNEALSIIENVGLMGVPIPSAITNAIDILKKKGDDNDKDND